MSAECRTQSAERIAVVQRVGDSSFKYVKKRDSPVCGALIDCTTLVNFDRGTTLRAPPERAPFVLRTFSPLTGKSTLYPPPAAVATQFPLPTGRGFEPEVIPKEKGHPTDALFLLACLEGLEPPTLWFVAKYSIQLSYKHKSI